MKVLVVIIVLSFCLAVSVVADDLYKVTLHSHRDALALRSVNADVIMSVRDGYLILADRVQSETLRQSGLEIELLASDLNRDQLRVDGRFDRRNAERFEVLYEDGRLRLLLFDIDRKTLVEEPAEVIALPDWDIEISYREPSGRPLPDFSTAALEDIQTLMDRVDQDSLEAYVLRLQAFSGRLTGTDSNYAARDYIAAMFTEFGYDSVVIDPFPAQALPQYQPCEGFNVIAYKVGTTFPDQHIIIGGHFDAVPGSPGADDNGTGTAAVLECARILKDVDISMTLVFVAFDAEESGLWGAYHYVNNAVETDEDIVLMINADMIAHWDNFDRADLYTGTETIYAQLWDELANTYVGIDADIGGSSGSDHWPFQQRGYDVIFVQEKNFSSVYHTSHDSTAYLDFEYMTRMVQATVATIYSVDLYPPPVRITSIIQGGDGQSLNVNWQEIRPGSIAYFRFSHYPVADPLNLTTIDLPADQRSYMVNGLTEGEEYGFYVQSFNDLDQTSLAFYRAYGIPSSVPVAPAGIVAMPVKDAVKVSWADVNTELDFNHCDVVRDGEVVGETADTFYIDDDPALGSDLHYYYVVAVDNDGNSSDSTGTTPLWAKAALLSPERILAINRSHVYPVDFVDASETGWFMREALAGYNFDYRSDTAGITCRVDCDKLELNDLVDYGLLVIGAETGLWEDLAQNPLYGGILDTLAYYLSIGGKAAVFGRWGDLGVARVLDYVDNPEPWDDAYHDFFHIDIRTQTPTYWDTDSTKISADLVAAHPNINTYPDLIWDSLATLYHASSQSALITDLNAIPCVSFVNLASSQAEVIYTYDSRLNDPMSEGQPVAWRYFGPDYCYVYFDIPLSFFDRESAIAALRQAVDELLSGEPEPSQPPEPPEPPELPQSFALSQNYPNPFNPGTEIQYSLPSPGRVRLSIFNILGQKVTTIVDEEKPAGNHTVRWNGTDSRGQAVASGIYLYQVKVGDYTESRKMILIR